MADMDELKDELSRLIAFGSSAEIAAFYDGLDLSPEEEVELHAWGLSRIEEMRRKAIELLNRANILAEAAKYMKPGETIREAWDRFPADVRTRLDYLVRFPSEEE